MPSKVVLIPKSGQGTIWNFGKAVSLVPDLSLGFFLGLLGHMESSSEAYTSLTPSISPNAMHVNVRDFSRNALYDANAMLMSYGHLHHHQSCLLPSYYY